MRLILHIGTEKTGTTSVQNWFSSNRQALIEQGVFYSSYLGEVNHLKIFMAALSIHDDSRAWKAQKLETNRKKREFLRAFPDELRAEIEHARALGCDRFMISNEHCHSKLQKRRQIKRLNEILSPLFEQIDVVMCLRPQVDVIVSRASTAARKKWKVTANFFTVGKHPNGFYNYLASYKSWTKCFADHTLHVVPFQRNPNMVAYFEKFLGIKAVSLKSPVRQNEALDVRTVAMLNFLRPQYEIDASGLNIFRPRWVNQLPVNETMQIGAELATQLQATFEESNRALCEVCPSVEMTDFAFKAGKYDAPNNLDMLSDPTCFEEQKAILVRLLKAANKTPPDFLS